MSKNLSELKIGESSKVIKLECETHIKRRFLDFGLVKNATIKKVRVSPSGDPTAYEIKGTLIALRESDAKKIIIK